MSLEFVAYNDLAFAHAPSPTSSATFKSIPEDFIVDEIADFEFSGEGEHLYLYIEKRELNTLFFHFINK